MKTLKRRRKEFKTDYKKRKGLLKSGKPRIVFRRTNKYLIAQYVESEEAQDKILFGISSKNLVKFGWPKNFLGSLKSIPAAYLTGFLFGKTIKEKKLKDPIVDFGMLRMEYKTKVYAFLKGLIDSGINISCPEGAFPEAERIEGKNLKEDFSNEFKKIKEKIEK